MQIVNRLGDLVDDEAFVFFLEDIFSYQRVQVDVHELKDEVDVAFVLGFDDFLQGNDVGVLDLIEEHDFAVRALGVSRVLERVKVLFQCVDSLVLFVNDFPDDAISAAADFLHDLVPLQDVGFDFVVGFAHSKS
jgi:hypothetical protein